MRENCLDNKPTKNSRASGTLAVYFGIMRRVFLFTPQISVLQIWKYYVRHNRCLMVYIPCPQCSLAQSAHKNIVYVDVVHWSFLRTSEELMGQLNMLHQRHLHTFYFELYYLSHSCLLFREALAEGMPLSCGGKLCFLMKGFTFET